ncbi:MAG: hypothetical protein ACREDR_17460 [Blastocatellia bacterium]
MDIHTLHRQGHSIRALVDLTGRARNIIRKTLRKKASNPSLLQSPVKLKGLFTPEGLVDFSWSVACKLAEGRTR